MSPNEVSPEDSVREVQLPPDQGLAVRLERDGRVSLTMTPDHHYANIHPNCFGPAEMSDVRLLHGGGSGTAVFQGKHPRFSEMVMKHGNAKDTKEVVALATISEELNKRSKLSEKAAEAMRSRIPEFVMVYLSPCHLRDRGKELWCSLRSTMVGNGMLQSLQRARDVSSSEPTLADLCVDPSSHGRRAIRISNQNDCVELEVALSFVVLYAPTYQRDGIVPDGIPFLRAFAEELEREQREHNWKVTLAQQTIGGPTSENGATALSTGKLEGSQLKKLMEEFTDVMQELRRLTFPEEESSLDEVQSELRKLELSKDVEAVSKNVDSFVGSAIRKNFLPEDGRFPNLRKFGHTLKHEPHSISLTSEEALPASFLCRLLQRGVDMSKIFARPPGSTMPLDDLEHSWLDIIRLATSLDHPSATRRIWTCGLTDAGLHNTFFSKERGLELFDLGEPHAMPQPAFLTKFLMSFFHTLGMNDDGHGSWIRRFDLKNGLLQTTPQTAQLIPYICNAFNTAIDHFIKEIFEGDMKVRELLIKYTILQLLSDASFCVSRWEEKGGGNKRFGPTSSNNLEKWLWRSLWDLYIATYVYNRILPLES